MSQFLRPDSNVTQSSFTNGFAEIDEATASDADFAYGANGVAATLEVGLSNPSGAPGSGTATVRYRVGRTNNGVLNGSGNACTVTCSVVQGSTVIASDAARTASGTWTAYSFTPDMSSVTDWTDLRLRFVTSASGGSSTNKRGGAVSWAELEAPDAATSISGSLNKTLGAATAAASGKVAIAGAVARTLGAATLSATGTITDPPAGPVTGTLSKTLGGMTSSGTAKLSIIGQAAKVLGGLASAAVGKLRLTASAARTLGGATLAAAGQVSGGGGGGPTYSSCRWIKNKQVHRRARGFRRINNWRD